MNFVTLHDVSRLKAQYMPPEFDIFFFKLNVNKITIHSNFSKELLII